MYRKINRILNFASMVYFWSIGIVCKFKSWLYFVFFTTKHEILGIRFNISLKIKSERILRLHRLYRAESWINSTLENLGNNIRFFLENVTVFERQCNPILIINKIINKVIFFKTCVISYTFDISFVNINTFHGLYDTSVVLQCNLPRSSHNDRFCLRNMSIFFKVFYKILNN